MAGIDITFGGYQPPASVHNRAASVFGDALGRRLGERLGFELDGDMCASRGWAAVKVMQGVETGNPVMCYFAASYLADRVPEIAIFDLPFVVADRAAAYAALDGGLGEMLARKFLADTGYRVLGFWDNGFRHFTNGVRAIRRPQDCAGLSIRTMDSEVHRDSFRRMGFQPKFVDVRDLPQAVKSGDIDAQENPLTNTYNFGTYRHHRHITLSAHFFGLTLFLCHRESFAAWPGEVQDAVIAAAREATRAQRQFALAEDAEILAKLDPAENEVISLSDAERAEFIAAVAPVIAAFKEKFGPELFEYFA